MASRDRLLSLPIELRDDIYQLQLKNTNVYHVKTVFTKRKHLKPFMAQWLLPVSTPNLSLLSTSHQVNAEVYKNIITEALKEDRKIIARVKNFDFRALRAFIESLQASQKDKINATPQPKLIVLLEITNTHELDAKKLGRWLQFLKTEVAGVSVDYHVGDVVEPELFWERIQRMHSALRTDGDMHEIFKACAVWIGDRDAAAEVVESWYAENEGQGGDEDEYQPDEDVQMDDSNENEEGITGGGDDGEQTVAGAADEVEGESTQTERGQDEAHSSTRDRVTQQIDEDVIGTGHGMLALFGVSHLDAYGQQEDEEEEEEEVEDDSDLDSDMMSSDGGDTEESDLSDSGL